MTKTNTLLLAIGFPPGTNESDPEDIADIIASIINEERQRNADEAGQPDYYTPVTVSAIPAAQWLTANTIAALKQAVKMGWKPE